MENGSNDGAKVWLIEQIDKAFQDVRRPAITDFTENNTEEEATIAKAFYFPKWKLIPVETIIRHRDGLAFLKPAAFQFCLPAFMMAAFSEVDEANDIRDNILFSCAPPTPSESPRLRDWSRSRLCQLSVPQRVTLANFLNYPNRGAIENQRSYVAKAITYVASLPTASSIDKKR